MRTVTEGEVLAAEKLVHTMDEGETFELMIRMAEEQPYIQVYIAATIESDGMDGDNDMDALANLASIVWVTMSTAAHRRIAEVTSDDIEAGEEKLMQLLLYAEGEPEDEWMEFAETLMESLNQKPLVSYIVQELAAPDNPYGVSPEGVGTIFSTLNVIINCLDAAAFEEE